MHPAELCCKNTASYESLCCTLLVLVTLLTAISSTGAEEQQALEMPLHESMAYAPGLDTAGQHNTAIKGSQQDLNRLAD